MPSFASGSSIVPRLCCELSQSWDPHKASYREMKWMPAFGAPSASDRRATPLLIAMTDDAEPHVRFQAALAAHSSVTRERHPPCAD